MAEAIHLEKPRGGAPAQPLNDLQRILLLIGQLNYAWTNTETLLIHLIAGLAKTDKETAIIIFLTLNTSRARLDLVERLAKSGRVSDACRDELLEITGGMTDTLKTRNHYSHCLYAFDSDGSNAKTILMRVADHKKNISYGKTMSLNGNEIASIAETIRCIEAINKKIWRFLRQYDFPI